MMNEFHKDKTKFYARGLLAVAVLLGALAFLRIAGFLTTSSEARAMAAKMDPNGENAKSPVDMTKVLASAKAGVEELKKKNLFVLTPPRQNPVGEVVGILGDEALINGKWCKVGESVGDAKIVAISPTKVKIAWDGKETEFSPIGSSGGAGQPDRSGPSRPGGRPGPGGKPRMVVTGAHGPVAQGGQKVSGGEQNPMQEQGKNMSPEERQRARQEMRQRLGTRGR
jgi:hypothetical protein